MSEPIGPVNEQYETVTGAGIIWTNSLYITLILSSGPQPVNLAEYERYSKVAYHKS